MKKVLFLLALATAKSVGELQALSRLVSFVHADACVSYVPKFVAQTESLSNPVPHSFLVKSLILRLGCRSDVASYGTVPRAFVQDTVVCWLVATTACSCGFRTIDSVWRGPVFLAPGFLRHPIPEVLVVCPRSPG